MWINTLNSRNDITDAILGIIKNNNIISSSAATSDTYVDKIKRDSQTKAENASENKLDPWPCVKIPIFQIGPLKINGGVFKIPIATHDELLVENLNRMTKLVFEEGVKSERMHESMCTVSVAQFKTAKQTGQALLWLNNPTNFNLLKNAYENSCRVTILCRLHGKAAERFLSIRFTLQQDRKNDSMEIRNVTKGMQAVLGLMKQIFDDMKIVSCTGDLRCSSQDKSCVSDPPSCSPCNLMTVEGMGECVVTKTVISAQLIRKTFKSSLQDFIMAHKLKNLIDSSTTLNPQTASVVSSVYMALGRNPMQMILRSSCVTTIKLCQADSSHVGEALHISCTFPSFSSGLGTDDLLVYDRHIISNFNDIISSIVMLSELDQLRELVENLK